MSWHRVYLFFDADTDEVMATMEANPGQGVVVVDRWPADPDDPTDASERLAHVRPKGRAWPETPPHGEKA